MARAEEATHTAVRPSSSPKILPKVESNVGAGSFAKESQLSFLFTKVLVALFTRVMKFTLATLYISEFLFSKVLGTHALAQSGAACGVAHGGAADSQEACQ
jgi:hypothetical protein